MSDDLLKRLDERDKEVAPGNLYGLAAARIRELEAQVAAREALLDECERDLMNIVTLANGERNVDHYTRECLFKLRGEQQ